MELLFNSYPISFLKGNSLHFEKGHIERITVYFSSFPLMSEYIFALTEKKNLRMLGNFSCFCCRLMV